MRATPDQRDTNDLQQSAAELAEAIVATAAALVNTGCVIALAHPDAARQEEARILVLEMNRDVHELEEIRGELTERGE